MTIPIDRITTTITVQHTTHPLMEGIIPGRIIMGTMPSPARIMFRRTMLLQVLELELDGCISDGGEANSKRAWRGTVRQPANSPPPAFCAETLRRLAARDE